MPGGYQSRYIIGFLVNAVPHHPDRQHHANESLFFEIPSLKRALFKNWSFEGGGDTKGPLSLPPSEGFSSEVKIHPVSELCMGSRISKSLSCDFTTIQLLLLSSPVSFTPSQVLIFNKETPACKYLSQSLLPGKPTCNHSSITY